MTFASSLMKLRYPELESVVASVCTGAIVVGRNKKIRYPKCCLIRVPYMVVMSQKE